LVLLLHKRSSLHHVANNLDTDSFPQKVVCAQVLRDEETCGGESFKVGTEKRKVFSCGSSAFFKDVHSFEGLFMATFSFDFINFFF
jgi:hypothetical protein